jgi:hypothetical protein
MRVNLHDFTGHPFQVQLARALAARGHDVLHLYAGQYEHRDPYDHVVGHGAAVGRVVQKEGSEDQPDPS